MNGKIVECFEAELAKILGEKNSVIMVNMVLTDLNKTPDDVTVNDVPALWRAIENNLVALLGVSGVKVLEDLLYNRFREEGFPEIASHWSNLN